MLCIENRGNLLILVQSKKHKLSELEFIELSELPEFCSFFNSKNSGSDKKQSAWINSTVQRLLRTLQGRGEEGLDQPQQIPHHRTPQHNESAVQLAEF